MSAHQGDSSPDVFVFPPFAPPAPRQEAPPAPVEETPPATPDEAESYAYEVPLPAHDLGDPEMEIPAAQASGVSWEMAGEPAPAPGAAETDEAAEDEGDLPWLELPEGSHTVHATDAPMEMPPPLPDTAAETAPAWMSWEGEESALGATAAEMTPPALATAGELTSVSEVPSPALETVGFDEPEEATAGFGAPEDFGGDAGFAPLDAYAPQPEPVHPETMPGEAPEAEVHSWPVEAMEPAALQSAEAAPVVETPVAPDAVAVHAPAIDHSAFGHIAGRLEEFARSLRNDPGGFVAAHHDDPLALLIAGFAMGYRQGVRAND